MKTRIVSGEDAKARLRLGVTLVEVASEAGSYELAVNALVSALCITVASACHAKGRPVEGAIASLVKAIRFNMRALWAARRPFDDVPKATVQ